MPPKKGLGKPKGKQPAMKTASKRPAEPVFEDDDPRELEEQRLILFQLEEMERAQGLSPGDLPAPAMGSGGKPSCPIVHVLSGAII